MRPAAHFTISLLLASLTLAMAFVWLRSYWRVDKVRAQVLPHFVVNARVVPGRITFDSSRTAVPLPVADSYWFSWPVDNYFAADIPRPNNPLFGEVRFSDGSVTLPLWLLAALATLASSVYYAGQRLKRRLGASLVLEPNRQLAANATLV